jgi:hypothetical protein
LIEDLPKFNFLDFEVTFEICAFVLLTDMLDRNDLVRYPFAGSSEFTVKDSELILSA